MAFRDDRDALRAQRESLEREVRDLEGQLGETRRKLRSHEDKDVEDEAEIARLRKEVERLRKRAGESGPSDTGATDAKKTTRMAMTVVAGLAVASATLIAIITSRTSPKHEDRQPSQAPAAAATTGAHPARPTRLDVATFGAVVLSSEGVDVAPGDGCVLETRIAGAGRLGRTRVLCGEAILYDSQAELGAGITSSSTDLTTFLRPDGPLEHSVEYVDVGTRTGPRPQISVDTQAQRMRVWRDGAEPFEVHLYVDDRSGPWLGRAVSGGRRQSDLDRLHLRATATDTTGPYPEAVDDGCELMGHAESETGLDCRTLLRCGATIVYGAGTTGYNDCHVQESGGTLIAAATDNETTAGNSDPIFLLDVPGRKITVSDERSGTPWQVDLALSEDPRCNLDGVWAGVIRDAEKDTPLALSAGGQDAAPTLTLGSNGPTEASVELDCVRGAVTIAAPETGAVEARFGPGFQTVLGRATADPPRVLWLRRRPERGSGR